MSSINPLYELYKSGASKQDRRSVRSRNALFKALAEEINETQDLSRVTVVSVSERAGLTRRTFYSHFRDIPDLVRHAEAKTLSDLASYIQAISDTDLEVLYQHIALMQPCPGAVAMLEYIQQNYDMYRALLGQGGDPAFVEKIKDMARQVVRNRALQGLNMCAEGAFFEYYLTFVISAEAGVLVRWLEQGMPEHVEIMARVMTMLLFIRPGDLYGNPVTFDIASYGMALMSMKGNADER